MNTKLFPPLLSSLLLVLAGPTAVARTIEFENTEVTDADVALSSNKGQCNGQLTFLEGHRSLYYWIILAQVID